MTTFTSIRPALVIGTVDKFAMLAWQPEARSIFGLAADGSRLASPPSLIIQDELHLISGPLGSMVGLYEPVIEQLCTDARQEPPARPKIISSTATIRSYREQIRDLYARDEACLFPPPGLDADDSFFARCAQTPDGQPERGRIYVGVHAPGLGSLQTVQVRALTALLQAPQPFDASERDPWWTLMLFFNSLRELGTTVTLFQSDIPDYLKVLRSRYGLDFRDLRSIRNILELTGRLPGDEVPKAISALEVPTDSERNYPIDVCLASNIIEVGVDIDRLSLMAVIGQPKTTSQYIQVTGRVGRKKDRPGLIVMVYAASKPRDRSHFEKFRSYHERLYAQVEPTSVTPFSRPALDRAAHAVVTSYVRQFGDQDEAVSPYPFPEDLAGAAMALLEQRAAIIDPDEMVALQRVLARARLSGAAGSGSGGQAACKARTCPCCGLPGLTWLKTRRGYLGQHPSHCGTSMRNAKSRSPSCTCSRRRTMPRGPVCRGQLIAPFGPGAMLVLPDGTSVICGGLDHWFKHETGDETNIDRKEYEIDEWRLANRLNVERFYLPPDYRRIRRGEAATNAYLTVPFLRFPQWHYCTLCGFMTKLPLVARGRVKCPDCEGKRRTRFLVQVPFVAMCDAGHIQDFPWLEWVYQTPSAAAEQPAGSPAQHRRHDAGGAQGQGGRWAGEDPRRHHQCPTRW